MRKPVFSKLSTAVLESYRKDIEKELANRSNIDRKRDRVMAKVLKMLKSEGMTLEDLNAAKAPRAGSKRKVAAKPRAKVAPKYRNPKNAAEQWTGRGRQPLWVAAFIKDGGKLDQLLIKK
ncbi:MAG: H-NS histone family protein [Pseudomonadota bacterium]